MQFICLLLQVYESISFLARVSDLMEACTIFPHSAQNFYHAVVSHLLVCIRQANGRGVSGEPGLFRLVVIFMVNSDDIIVQTLYLCAQAIPT